MRSTIPKVLHHVRNKSLLAHVIDRLSATPISDFTVILGRDLSSFRGFMADYPQVQVCIQEQANGTGGAVAAAAAGFSGIAPLAYAPCRLERGTAHAPGYALICAGDTPAIDAKVVTDLIHACENAAVPIGVLGMKVPDPHGYGRLVLDSHGALDRIVEERDTDTITRAIAVVNTGIVYADVAFLFSLLQDLRSDNSQSEYYLTDCFALARQQGIRPVVHIAPRWEPFSGVNTPEQLAEVAQLI